MLHYPNNLQYIDYIVTNIIININDNPELKF